MGRQRPPGVRLQANDESARSRSEWRKNIDIMKWIDPEKKWKKISNLPLSLCEENANVISVTKMGGEAAVLLDVDHLKLIDSGTSTGQYLPQVT